MIAPAPVERDADLPARPGLLPDPEVPERAQRRRFSAAYKLRFLNEYGSPGPQPDLSPS